MGTMDWHKCIACRKEWVKSKLAKIREQYARDMIKKYPDSKDWLHIRWSDECHSGWGPEGKIYIIRKKGTRYCPDCIQHASEESDKEDDRKRIHVWAAVGYNFKYDLSFYEVLSNNNGKMSLQVYRDCILEPVVKPWLLQMCKGLINPWVLEEDGDSGHGGKGKKGNIVKTWKQDNNLPCIYNCPGSPDLAPIENC